MPIVSIMCQKSTITAFIKFIYKICEMSLGNSRHMVLTAQLSFAFRTLREIKTITSHMTFPVLPLNLKLTAFQRSDQSPKYFVSDAFYLIKKFASQQKLQRFEFRLQMSDYWTIICRARTKRVDIFRCLSNGIVTYCILIN